MLVITHRPVNTSHINYTTTLTEPIMEDEEYYSRTEIVLLSTSMFLMTLTGFYLNFSSAILMRKLPRFQNAFGVLTMSHAYCDSGVAFIYTIWIFPNSFFSLPDTHHYLNTRLCQFSLFCQTGAFHAMFLISLNRYMAIAHPTEYRTYFTVKNAYFMILVNFCLSATYASIYFFNTCDFYFSSSNMILYFSNTDCGIGASLYVDFIYSVAIFTIICSMDCVTLIRMSHARKKLFADTMNNSDELHKRSKKERVLVMQACVSTSLYCFGLFNFHVTAILVTSNVAIFFATTFTFGMAHAGDGIVLIIFYPELRERIWPPWRLYTHKFHSKNPRILSISTSHI